MVLKTISSANKPFIKDNLINIIEELFKKELYENNDCPIESDYIQILAEKFIDELEKEKLMYYFLLFIVVNIRLQIVNQSSTILN